MWRILARFCLFGSWVAPRAQRCMDTGLMPPRLPIASMPPSPPAAASCPRSALVRATFMWNLCAARVSLPLDACAAQPAASSRQPRPPRRAHAEEATEEAPPWPCTVHHLDG
jgi:hypothetical protein